MSSNNAASRAGANAEQARANARASAKDAAEQTGIAARETAEQARQATIETAKQTKQAVEETAEQGKELAKDAAHETKVAAKQTAEQARQAAEQAKEVTKEKAEQAKQVAKDVNDTIWRKLEEDGVENPKGLAMLAFGGVFLAAVPVTSWLAQPGGLVEKSINGVVSTVGWLSSAGSNNTSTISQTGKISALAALYVTVTYALSGAGSAAGVDAGSKEGRDNNYPRQQFASLRGLPHRMCSAHFNLMEMFPGWAVTAALAQTIAPADQTVVNLLGLHVLSKVFVYYPAYIFNVGPARSLAHVVATASVINVALRLAKRPLL